MLQLSELKLIPAYFLEWIMENIDEKGESIHLGEGKIWTLCEEDVERVYKIPRGPLKIDLEKESKQARDRLREEIGLQGVDKGTRVATSILESAMVKIDNDGSWVKAAILFFIGSLLCPRDHAEISLKYAFLLEQDLERIKSYNWCSHVLEHTTKALATKTRTNTKANFHFLLVSIYN